MLRQSTGAGDAGFCEVPFLHRYTYNQKTCWDNVMCEAPVAIAHFFCVVTIVATARLFRFVTIAIAYTLQVNTRA